MNLEQMFTYWKLKDLINCGPWVDYNFDDGPLMKLKLDSELGYITVAYKRFYDGTSELRYIETQSTTCSQESTGEVKFWTDTDIFFDDEAVSMLEKI